MCLVPVVRQSDEGGESHREVFIGQFGLMPFWAKDPTVARRTYNARSETADTKPNFRDAWRRGDEQAALHVAERDLGLEADAEAELLERVRAYELWQAYQGFFAVIFWYALLGPLPALAYRLLAALPLTRRLLRTH